MADLNQVELQNLRHLIGAHETSYQKLNVFIQVFLYKKMTEI